jgi:hypothetical protein
VKLNQFRKKCIVCILLIVPLFISYKANAEEEHGTGKVLTPDFVPIATDLTARVMDLMLPPGQSRLI